MPADVAARIDAALRRPGRGRVRPCVVARSDAARARRRRRRGDPPGRRRRRGRRRWSAAISAALGRTRRRRRRRLDRLGRRRGADDGAARAARARRRRRRPCRTAPRPARGAQRPGPTTALDSIGAGCRRATGRGARRPADSGANERARASPGGRRPRPCRTPLARLTEPAALRACLTRCWPAHPGTVTVRRLRPVRRPAGPGRCVVRQAAGARRWSAVGPDCGLSGADEKAPSRVT